jgi:hypothetical protein
MAYFRTVTKSEVEAAMRDLPGCDMVDLATELGTTTDEVERALGEEDKIEE